VIYIWKVLTKLCLNDEQNTEKLLVGMGEKIHVMNLVHGNENNPSLILQAIN